MSEDLKEKLVELECHLHKPEVRSSLEELDLLIDDHFLEFGSSGISFSKKEVLEWLPAEKKTEISASNFELKILVSDLALLLYKSKIVETIHNPPEIKYSLRSSIWKKVNNQWRIIFHQGMPCDPF